MSRWEEDGETTAEQPCRALGHPLGASGVRQAVTGIAELRRRGKEGSILCTSMCIGSG